MNISKFSALCFLATAAFAQQFPWEANPAPAAAGAPPDSTVSQEATPSSSSPEVAVYLPPPAPSSSSAEEAKPAAPEGKTIFDNLRGHAYNPYSTVGAASTVGDLILLPSDINGQKFFYVSPTASLGYAAFPLDGSTALLGLDNSPLGSPAALILGYANSAFGIVLNYSVSKIWTSNTAGTADVSSRVTQPGDNIGLYFSVPLGSATFYANAGWLTYGTSTDIDRNGKDSTTDYSEIQANVGLTGNSGSLNYDGYLNVIRTGGTEIRPNGDKLVDVYSYLGAALNFNLGYAALQSSTARVIIGANNYVSIRFLDETKDPALPRKGDNVMGFVISPNILGEVSLSDNWLAFAGAAHALNLIAGNGDRIKDTSYLNIAHTDGTDAFAGVRYQKINWAVEAQVAADMFRNPFGGFNGSNMFAEFGGFVYF
jgi:hypothetical protein